MTGRRMLITTDAVGGVWTYALDLARGLARQGHEILLAVMGPAPNPAQRAEAAAVRGLEMIETGLPLDWTAETPAHLASASAGLADLARNVDSVHLHAPALVGQVRWPVPVVAVTHSCVGTWWAAMRDGPLPADLAWRAALTAEGLRAANAAIAPSMAHAAATLRCYGPMPLRVVHNGVPSIPASAGERQGVLTAGRLWDEAKGVAGLDRVTAVAISAAGPITGPNGQRIALQHIEHLGVLDPPGMQAAYARHRVYVSMARYEPFGLSVLEAARAGMALVLMDIPVFRELWNGAAMFVSTEADLPGALSAALDDDGLGPAACRRAERYSVSAMVDATLAVHRDVARVAA